MEGISSIPASALNLFGNVVGAGMFSMPWCLKEATLITGACVFLFMCTLNITSFMLLAESCELAGGKFSYLKLGEQAFGRRFGVVAQVTTICYAAGSLVSYVVLAADCMVGKGTGIIALYFGDGSFFGGGSFAARAVVTFGFATVAFLPMSLMRTLDSVKYAAIFAVGAVLFAGSVVVLELVSNPPESRADDDKNTFDDVSGGVASSVVYLGFPLSLWEAIPIINVSFTAHYNGPRFYQELSNRGLARFRRVVSLSLVSALVVYLAVAASGYLAFGDGVQGDVLTNFRDTYTLAVAARGCLLMVIFAVFPMAQNSLRNGLVLLLYPPEDEHGYPVTADNLPFGPYFRLTALVVFCAAMVGTVCAEVEVVLAYKGGIFGTLMVYLLPPLMRTALSEQALSRMKAGAAARAVSRDPRAGYSPLMAEAPAPVSPGSSYANYVSDSDNETSPVKQKKKLFRRCVSSARGAMSTPPKQPPQQ